MNFNQPPSESSGNPQLKKAFMEIMGDFGAVSLETQSYALSALCNQFTQEWQESGILPRVHAFTSSREILPYVPTYSLRRVGKRFQGTNAVEYCARVSRPDRRMAIFNADYQISLVPVARETAELGLVALNGFTDAQAFLVSSQVRTLLEEQAEGTLPGLAYDLSLPLKFGTSQ